MNTVPPAALHAVPSDVRGPSRSEEFISGGERELFIRSWRPTGVLLVLANLVYGMTDPPLRWLRRVVPVLRLGGVGLDLSFLVLVFGIMLLQGVLALLH